MKNLLPFLAVLITAFSINAQDWGSRAMLSAAQAKIGKGSKAALKQVAGNDKLAMFEKDGGGFAVVKNDGIRSRVIAYSDNGSITAGDITFIYNILLGTN